MHSHEYSGIEGGPWTVHHNGDYSGDVVIEVNTYHPNHTYEQRVTFHDLSAQRKEMQRLIHGPDDLMSDGYEVKIPFELMKRIVAEKIRSDMMERIEEMEPDEILRELMR